MEREREQQLEAFIERKLSLNEIAQELHITRQRVDQILRHVGLHTKWKEAREQKKLDRYEQAKNDWMATNQRGKEVADILDQPKWSNYNLEVRAKDVGPGPSLGRVRGTPKTFRLYADGKRVRFVFPRKTAQPSATSQYWRFQASTDDIYVCCIPDGHRYAFWPEDLTGKMVYIRITEYPSMRYAKLGMRKKAILPRIEWRNSSTVGTYDWLLAQGNRAF